MMRARTHWLLLRLSSLPLVPLFFYFIYAREYILAPKADALITWLAMPINAAAVSVFVVCGFLHGWMGVEEIIEDYVTASTLKKVSLILNAALFLALGCASLFALFNIYHFNG